MKEYKRGFVLGIVVMVTLLMAVFIFSYNSIVRRANIQAHHERLVKIADQLAISGVTLIGNRLSQMDYEQLLDEMPELLNRVSDIEDFSIGSSLSNRLRQDYQTILNQLNELQDPSALISGYPQVSDVTIGFKNIRAINLRSNATTGDDMPSEQFRHGRDPVEKVGELVVSCTIEHMGVSRKASIRRQFRVVSMVPGPFARFTLFTSTTPHPHSYNAMGVHFSGAIEPAFSYEPAGMSFSGNLRIYNGTDSLDVTPSVAYMDLDDDKRNLRNRGWIFLGPSPMAFGEPLNQREGPVFLNIPSGFNQQTGGEFMIGWPTSYASMLLPSEQIDDDSHFASASAFVGHNYLVGGTFRGFYVSEEGNPMGAGARNLWPGLSLDPTTPYQHPDDHFLSAASWLFPYGTRTRASRTLVVGPAMAGFLKFYFIRGTNAVGDPYRGIFTSMPTSAYDDRIDNNRNVDSFAGAGLWLGDLVPDIRAEDFFLQGYDSFERLFPYNSLPQNNPPDAGIAFNMLFDFMKYDRDSYPSLDAPPSLASTDFAGEDILVPGHSSLSDGPIYGIHPYNNFNIFFQDGQYNTAVYPDNCYYSGDLRELSIESSNLMVNPRVTHILDMSNYSSLSEENERVKRYLFRTENIAGVDVSVPRRSGIFYIMRRTTADLEDPDDALVLTDLPVRLDRSLIVICNDGGVKIAADIICNDFTDRPENLFTIALRNGDIFLAGGGTRRIDAYLAALSGRPQVGRLLNEGVYDFVINGGLAVTELGLHQGFTRTTMRDFPSGGEINYNIGLNPSTEHYFDAYFLLLEDSASRITLTGGR